VKGRGCSSLYPISIAIECDCLLGSWMEFDSRRVFLIRYCDLAEGWTTEKCACVAVAADFSRFRNVRTGCGPIKFPVQWVPAALPAIKRPQREAAHSPPTYPAVFNLLAPELFFFNFSTPVYKM